MAILYTTVKGDVIDAVANNIYGRYEDGMVELILNMNLHLADYGAVLPAGVAIVLPEINNAPKTVDRLWL